MSINVVSGCQATTVPQLHSNQYFVSQHNSLACPPHPLQIRFTDSPACPINLSFKTLAWLATGCEYPWQRPINKVCHCQIVCSAVLNTSVNPYSAEHPSSTHETRHSLTMNGLPGISLFLSFQSPIHVSYLYNTIHQCYFSDVLTWDINFNTLKLLLKLIKKNSPI